MLEIQIVGFMTSEKCFELNMEGDIEKRGKARGSGASFYMLKLRP